MTRARNNLLFWEATLLFFERALIGSVIVTFLTLKGNLTLGSDDFQSE